MTQAIVNQFGANSRTRKQDKNRALAIYTLNGEKAIFFEMILLAKVIFTEINSTTRTEKS